MKETDKLTDFERAEYYHKKYGKRMIYTVIIALVCFALGYALAKIVDGTNPTIQNISR